MDDAENLEIDPAQLDAIQRELDAVQGVLDGLDRIAPATAADGDPAAEILALVAVGFDGAGSDLIGDGDVVFREQVETIPEAVAPLGVVVEPAAPEVGDTVSPGAEALLDLHDDPAVGHAEDVGPREALHEGVEGSHHPG